MQKMPIKRGSGQAFGYNGGAGYPWRRQNIGEARKADFEMQKV